MAQSNDEIIFDLDVDIEEIDEFGLGEKSVTQVYQPIKSSFLKPSSCKNTFIDEIDKLLEESLGYVPRIRQETYSRKIPVEDAVRVNDRTQMLSDVGMFKPRNLSQAGSTKESVGVTLVSSQSISAFSKHKPAKQLVHQGGWIEAGVCQSQKWSSKSTQFDRPTTALPSQRMIDSIQQSSFGEKSASKRSIFQTAAANNLDSEKGSIASQRPGMV